MGREINMSIVNQIAAFGRDAGSGITSGLNEARRRKESDRSYNSIQQRYDLQDKRYNNEISRMEQERQRQAQETERQYAADGVQAIYSAPPEFRAQAYQGWLQGAQQRGYDVAGAPPEYSDEVLYKLAGSVGANLKPDSSKAPANIQEWDAFQKMTPEEKAQFLNMKRASKTLNLGGSQVVLDPAGDVSKRYQVTPKPQDMPEFKADVTREQETAKQDVAGNAPPAPTTGQDQVDKEFAKEYASWTAGGGFADTQKQLKQLEAAHKALQGKQNLTGPVLGRMPDFVRSTTNPESISVREDVEEVVQRNLRVILGAQFTEKEGERLIKRAYNENLEEPENAKRVGRLIDQIRTAAMQKADAMRYFEKNGTLQGWQGRLPTMSDFTDINFDSGGQGNARNRNAGAENTGGWSIRMVK